MALSRRAVLALAGTPLLASARNASAQTWPDRPVRVIVGFPAGGSVDIFVRIVAQSLSEQLGQPFVIENRPGASGNIGTEAVVRSAPDGYTLLAVGVTNATGAALYDNLKFDFLRDIVPIASTVRGVGVLVVNPALPATTHRGVHRATREPTPARSTSPRPDPERRSTFTGELFMQMTGVAMVHVPYRGSPQSLTGLIAGEVQAMFDTLSTSIEHIKAGRLRALGVTSATADRGPARHARVERSRAGLRGDELAGFGAPKDTPRRSSKSSAGRSTPPLRTPP